MKQIHRQADTQTHRHADKRIRRHADKQTRRQADTQTRRHANKQTRRQVDISVAAYIFVVAGLRYRRRRWRKWRYFGKKQIIPSLSRLLANTSRQEVADYSCNCVLLSSETEGVFSAWRDYCSCSRYHANHHSSDNERSSASVV